MQNIEEIYRQYFKTVYKYLFCLTRNESISEELTQETFYNAIKNIGKTPKHMSADTIYLNQINLSYFANNNIDGLIPTRKQSKEKIGKLNPKPLHKDHFIYVEEIDAFYCPGGEFMYFFKEYTKPNEDPNKPDKITRIYNNYSACKCCVHKYNCFTGKQTHRTITENGERMQRAMYHKMEKRI
jgi:hypothetical protein